MQTLPHPPIARRPKSTSEFENAFSKVKEHHSSRKSSLSQLNDWNFFETRKESQLNTLFKLRKRKLDQITRDNHMIYRKINAQESYYSIGNQHSSDNSRIKVSLSKYSTLDLRGPNPQERKMLGPIGGFQVLSLKEVKIGKNEKKRTSNNTEKVKECCSVQKIKSQSVNAEKTRKQKLPIVLRFC